MITAETLLDAARVLHREARHLEHHPDEAPSSWVPTIVEVRARASRLEELARSLEETAALVEEETRAAFRPMFDHSRSLEQ